MAIFSRWLVLAIVVSSVHGNTKPEPQMFSCSDGFMIPTYLICDGVADCVNGEDEQPRNCVLRRCSVFEFDCGAQATGRPTQCINLSWKCDGTVDCRNGKDEKSCDEASCVAGQFRCNNTRCISSSYVCDGDNDCGDHSDEMLPSCRASTSCRSSEFHCTTRTGPQCIPLSWTCDREMDCDDNSDETTYLCFYSGGPTCPLGTFNCTDSTGSNGNGPSCITWNRVCDGVRDCHNGKDERCPTVTSCPSGSFRCTEGNLCIREAWVCDGFSDCPDGSDEANCQMNCTAEQFSCITGGCVPQQDRCDGKRDCKDGTDEYNCPKPQLVECNTRQFTCADGLQCIRTAFMCNTTTSHCNDGSDELFCNQTGRGPCLESTDDCEQLCINISNTHTCGCSHGYRVNTTNRRTCIDIDECSQTPPKCSQLCTNIPGGYNCSCSTGYVADRTKCRAEDPAPAYLLYAYRASVDKLDISTSARSTLIQGLSNAVAIDYHYSLQQLFIADMTQDVILMASLRPPPGTPQVTTVISTEIGNIDGIAVDWINNKMYWTDSQLDHIEVADLDGAKRSILFANGLDKPRAIVVDPAHGLLFWTDWGSTPMITRASMDGTNRTTLHTQYLGWPNALTIDYPTQSIYWADALYHVIESSRTDGSNRWVVLSGAGAVQHPYGLSLFEDWLYWTDWKADAVLKCNKRGSTTAMTVQADLTLPLVMQAVHRAVQAPGPNPCALNNGGCQYLCLLREGGGYGCMCPTGVLLSMDGHSCQDIKTFIVFTYRVGIRRVSLDVPELVSVPLPVYNLSAAAGLAWDLPTNSLFWADKLIYVANLNGSNQRPLITNNIGTPVALAVDWQTRKLYWTDSGLKRIEVSNLDGTHRCILISSGLDLPRDIAVHPSAGYMFWTDWGAVPLIGRAALDGSGRTNLVTTNLKYINALAIDFDTNTLYWADAYTDLIETSDLNGHNRTVLLSNLLHPYGMALYGGYLYWTDWTSQTIQRVNKTTGGAQTSIISGIGYMNAIQVVNRNRKPGPNPCTANNGGCSHLCLTKPGGQNGSTLASCLCPTGFAMSNDLKTCASQINHYLLVAAGTTIHQVSLDVSYVADIVLPITGIINAVSVDVDIVQDMVYWSDDAASGIYRAPLTGGAAQAVIQQQIIQPTSLAVDWISRNIYWVDMGTQRMEVARLDGTNRMVLLSNLRSQGIRTPRGLALDLKFTYIYWTDDTSIYRMAMDGTMMTTLIGGQITPTSVAISNGWIVWSDPSVPSIAIANIDTGMTSQGVINAPGQQLCGVAVYNSYLYWVNRQDRSLHRAYFDTTGAAAHNTGANETIMVTRMAVDVWEVRLIQKSDLINGDFQHLCAQNRGCGSLCLPNVWSASLYSCACPTGIKLSADGLTCPKVPTTFLLVSVGDTIQQISLDTPNQDSVLLVSNQQNPQATDFLLTTSSNGQMFWVDPFVDAIFSSSLLESSPLTIVPNAGNPQGVAVDWIASNVYWTAQGSLQVAAGIYVARANGSFPRAVITRGVIYPGTLAIHPTQGYLFWVDQKPKPRIERCNLDGSNRMIIVNSTSVINELIVDYTTNKLYWPNSNHELRVCDLDGHNQRVFIPRPTNPSQQYLQQPYGMAKLGNQVFWTEWQTSALYRALQTGPSNFLLRALSIFSQQPTNLAIVNPLRPGELTPLPSPLPCSVNNGGCPQLCLASNSTHRLCGCSGSLTCNETFGVPSQPLPPVPQYSSTHQSQPLPTMSSAVSLQATSLAYNTEYKTSEDSVNVMLLGVNIVMSLVVVVVLTAIIIVLIVVARRYKEIRSGNSLQMNKQIHITDGSSNNRRVPFRLNNTKESIPLKNINSHPQSNLNQFKGEEPEYYDTSSAKGLHRAVPSIPDNPPMKHKGGVIEVNVEVEIEAKGPEETKGPKVSEEAKVPEVLETKVPGETQESENATETGNTTETNHPGSSKDPGTISPSSDLGTSGDLGTSSDLGTRGEKHEQAKPAIALRPITPRGAKKAALKFNLPPEPIASDPTTPPPALPPRSPIVPMATAKKDGPEQS